MIQVTTRRPAISVRPVMAADQAAWRLLWDGYNAFYGRLGPTALPEAVTGRTWERFLDPRDAVYALVAEQDDRLVGLAHVLFHPSTICIAPVCYLQDLFTAPQARGQGVARALLDAVAQRAIEAGAQTLYWLTQHNNDQARRLYDTVASHHGFIVYSRSLDGGSS